MDDYKQLLPGYIKNKSISTDAAFKDGIMATVAWLREQFTEGGFEVTVVEGYDNPIVVASYVADPKYQTCLIYGHYDVQPADQSEGWDSDPFDSHRARRSFLLPRCNRQQRPKPGARGIHH